MKKNNRIVFLFFILAVIVSFYLAHSSGEKQFKEFHQSKIGSLKIIVEKEKNDAQWVMTHCFSTD